MHNELLSVFNYSLQNRTDCIVEVDLDKLDQKPFMDEHVSRNALKVFLPSELHARELNLNFLNCKTNFLIKLKNGNYILENTDEVEEKIIKKVDEYYVYQFHYLNFFKAIAEFNNFGSVAANPLEDVFGIGSIDVGKKKIGWFFSTVISNQQISILKSIGFDYLIISSTKSNSPEKELSGVYHHSINFDFKTWKFDLSRIINPENGFEVHEYVEIAPEILILDSTNDEIYLKKTKLSRTSKRDFQYVMALTFAGERGLTKSRFAKHLSISQKQDVKTTVNLDKQRLKECIKQSFVNKSDMDEAFHLLDLGNATRGSLIKINLRPDQIKVF